MPWSFSFPKKRRTRRTSPLPSSRPAHYVLSVPPSPLSNYGDSNYYAESNSAPYSPFDSDSQLELDPTTPRLRPPHARSSYPKRVSFSEDTDFRTGSKKVPRLRRDTRHVSREDARGFDFEVDEEQTMRRERHGNAPYYPQGVPVTDPSRNSAGTFGHRISAYGLPTPPRSRTKDRRTSYQERERSTRRSSRRRSDESISTLELDAPMFRTAKKYAANLVDVSKSALEDVKQERRRSSRSKYDDRYPPDSPVSRPRRHRHRHQSASHSHGHGVSHCRSSSSRSDRSHESSSGARRPKEYFAISETVDPYNNIRSEHISPLYRSANASTQTEAFIPLYEARLKNVSFVDQWNALSPGSKKKKKEKEREKAKLDKEKEKEKDMQERKLQARNYWKGFDVDEGRTFSTAALKNRWNQELQDKEQRRTERRRRKNPLYGNRTFWVEDMDERRFDPRCEHQHGKRRRRC